MCIVLLYDRVGVRVRVRAEVDVHLVVGAGVRVGIRVGVRVRVRAAVDVHRVVVRYADHLRDEVRVEDLP